MTPDKLALKRATQEVIRGVGGLEAAAGFCRVGKSVLGCNQSVNEPDSFIAADVLADLQPLTRGQAGFPAMTRLLAAMDGFALVKLPDALPAKGDLLQLVSRQAGEGGQLAASICAALADGIVTRAEAREARTFTGRLIDVAVAMDAALAAIEAGEGQ